MLPTGEIVAVPARGMFTGNRGIIHQSDGRLGVRRWTHPHWIVCTLTHPKGRYHGPLPERGWSPLFFLDEAVALAAGHRPCQYCRPAAYGAWKKAWTRATGSAFDRMVMDRALHAARVTRSREQVRHDAALADMPDGGFVLFEGRAHLVLGDALLPFEPDGYGPPRRRGSGVVTVLSPAPTIAVLAAGYVPVVHDSATAR